ncbi:MAG: hypothetical protein IJ127_29920 [Afipia sp.]|nr:hypothetical protein [Afipia sp.]
MAEKPILFNTPMVRAILDGHKTVTRRVVNLKHLRGLENLTAEKILRCCIAPYQVGDILWVRETWCFYWGVYWHKAGLEVDENGYCKDGCWVNDAASPGGKRWLATKAPDKWRPSIHMPREAARIFLRVTDVRVERLQEMRAEDSLREGVKLHLEGCLNGEAPLKPFADLWDSTIKSADRGRYGWYANPWVWVVEFKRIPHDFPCNKEVSE